MALFIFGRDTLFSALLEKYSALAKELLEIGCALEFVTFILNCF